MKTQFDHISLSAKDPEAMKDFLCELLDLQAGTRPGFSFQGYFLFAGDEDIIHIFGRSDDSKITDKLRELDVQESEVQNIVHHVSFYSDDYDQTIQRIEQLNVKYVTYDVPDSNVKQLFVRAPENLLIEIQATPK
jgi:catechol 2,3-dioxygenase-like lactoylglutathione lyase family enzyme